MPQIDICLQLTCPRLSLTYVRSRQSYDVTVPLTLVLPYHILYTMLLGGDKFLKGNRLLPVEEEVQVPVVLERPCKRWSVNSHASL